MFDVRGEEPERLRQIVYAGVLGLLVGLALVLLNLIPPLVTHASYDASNVLFASLGGFMLVLFAKPTRDAIDELGWG